MVESETSTASNSKREANSADSKEPNGINVSPFKLEWTIGMDVDVAVVNLTTRKRHLIAYVCSHVVILYDYVAREMMSLQGHQQFVRSLSTSRDGKWLLSADYAEDSACIIWDTETRVSICSIFNPHGKNSLTTAKLSPDGKYFITVGNEIIQKVNFWLWTLEKDKPDATVELSETSTDRVKKISFNDEFPNEFALTLDRSVIFISWKNVGKLDVNRPPIPENNLRATECLNDSCYVSKTWLAMTVTNAGFVLIWRKLARNRGFERQRKRMPKKMSLVKAIPLQKGNLTTIENVDQIIAIGNKAGELYLYDHQLKLLYWCNNCGFDSIVSISFDRESDLKKPQIPTSESTPPKFNDEVPFNEEERPVDFHLNTKRESGEENSEECERKNSQLNEKLKDSAKHILKPKYNSLEATKQFAASTATVDIDYQPKGNKILKEPTNCALDASKFVIPKFFASDASGKIGCLDISSLICRFVKQPAEGAVTAIATQQKSDYLVTGNSLGLLCLYKYSTRMLMVRKRTPVLPDFLKILNFEEGKRNTTYITCPETHESLVGVSALKFSPATGRILACGLESGVIWILDPNTLDPIDPTPFKHSSRKVLDLVFSDCGKYLAYSDALTVGLFKKEDKSRSSGESTGKFRSIGSFWIFVGKYHSHYLSVKQILFRPPSSTSGLRFFSLGEDGNLVEYDLENSGSYPEPGLKILQTKRVERTSLPLCMTIYPECGVENVLIIANSEHKFKLWNDQSKTIKATFLGPTSEDPVQKMLIAESEEKSQKRIFLTFATTREIGLIMLPFDGNPHKIVAMVGHPKKIQTMVISGCGKYLFTVGENDRSAFMWKIKYRSVEKMQRLGGEKLSPFYSLIEGGKQGWLFKEMTDLFSYAQILQQGENTTSSRIVTDKVSIRQIPNLMRAIGFYPTNNELENMMEEISYTNYTETAELIDEISFENFVKLYINHRPVFGITKQQIKTAFKVFANTGDCDDRPTLTAKQFLDVLLGKHCQKCPFSNAGLSGDPLRLEEAHACLRRLVPQDEDFASYSDPRDAKTSELNFEFLPSSISYEDFMEEILGLEQLK